MAACLRHGPSSPDDFPEPADRLLQTSSYVVHAHSVAGMTRLMEPSLTLIDDFHREKEPEMATQLKTAPAVPARSDGLETVMKILVIDIGGTNVKMLAIGAGHPAQIPRPARN